MKKIKRYIRCCKKCGKMYKTIYHFSKVCPECDNLRGSNFRNKNKIMIKK